VEESATGKLPDVGQNTAYLKHYLYYTVFLIYVHV
jgi:hypothetical protein